MSITETETPVRASAFGCITIPFLLIACLPLAWGARANWLNGQLARTGDVVPGRVIELRFVPGNATAKSKRESALSPVVTFTTRSGEARTVVGSVNRSPDSWKVGGLVDVVYDPASPARADLLSEVANWPLWFGIWCLVAALPLAIAMAPVVLLVRQRRAQRQR
jgi:hypothetical protein